VLIFFVVFCCVVVAVCCLALFLQFDGEPFEGSASVITIQPFGQVDVLINPIKPDPIAAVVQTH
jgi:hypothetical protein